MRLGYGAKEPQTGVKKTRRASGVGTETKNKEEMSRGPGPLFNQRLYLFKMPLRQLHIDIRALDNSVQPRPYRRGYRALVAI